MKLLFTLFAALVLTSMANAAPESEPLMGHFTTKGAVNIQVRSGGCTYKRHFQVGKEVKDGYVEITFVRKQEDPCRAYLPYGEIITFSFEELGLRAGEKFKFGNPDSLIYVSRN
jgi:hypothetical protein